MNERRHLALVVLFPAVVQAMIVACFGEAMLAWDDFHYTHLLRAIGKGQSWWPFILQQHNEHRIVWTKLVLLAHAPFSSWNPKIDMYVSALLVATIAVGIGRLYRAAGDEPVVHLWPVAFLLCSVAQYMNMLYGLMTCHYFTVTFMVWSLVFLTRGTWPALAAAAGMAAAATVSTLNGIVIWPAGLIILFLQRRSWSRRVAWMLAAGGVALAYFAHFRGQMPALRSGGNVGEMSASAVAALGAPFAARSVPAAIALGVMTSALVVASWAGVHAERRWADQAGVVGLTLLALGSAASIGLGRRSFGLSAAVESKYVTYATLGLIGPYLTIARQGVSRARTRLLIACMAFFSVGLVAASWFGSSDLATWARVRRLHRYLAQTADMQTDETLASVYKPNEVRILLAYLRAARLGPFREHVDALLVARGGEGRPSHEILPGSEIRAKVLCPVETLHDMAVLIARAPADAAGILHVGLKADGRRVAHAGLALNSVRRPTWVPVEVETPVQDCRDRVLVVHVWTEGAFPGAGAVAVTFPPYYSGITRQGDAVLPGRELGIAFNGAANGLLP